MICADNCLSLAWLEDYKVFSVANLAMTTQAIDTSRLNYFNVLFQYVTVQRKTDSESSDTCLMSGACCLLNGKNMTPILLELYQLTLGVQVELKDLDL